MPDLPLRVYRNAETADVADEYDHLANWARQVVRDLIDSLKTVGERKI